ncbi:MAG: hypothetical protein ABS49_04840 [Erythrobacter sp. SCN 62-14]|mgnify:CR=1 FL=1|nr:MAG: hypothetical protein ABS49_04840 [Erythrobacter sp. SCN 62-14]
MPQADQQTSPSAQKVLEEYGRLTAMQELVSDISRGLVHCSVGEVQSKIEDTLARLGTFVRADRTYIFEFIPGDLARNTHEWCAEGIKPEIQNLQNLPRDMLEFWISSLAKGDVIHIPNVMELDDDRSFEREFLAIQDIQSLLVVPMVTAENLLGFVGFDSVRSHRTYAAGEVSLLKWIADLVCAALLRERATREMIAAEADLSLEKERFRIIADTVSDVLWDYDLANQTWWISKDWPKKLGISDNCSDGDARSWFERVHLEDRPKLIMSFRTLLKSTSDTWEVDYRFEGNDGELIDILAKATVLRGSDGRVFRMLGNARNITQEKRNREGYTRARALEAVGKLTGGIAHDFNNLLMIILGNAEFLEMSNLAEEDAEAVTMISQAAESAATLTRQLLAFSGQTQLKTTRVDLNALMSDTISLLRSGLPESVRLTQSSAADLWDADVDANGLQQAIMNLAMNANDAMPRGGEIAIYCENLIIEEGMKSSVHSLRPGRYVNIEVSDSGDGMSPEVLSRAFEPFFTTKDVGKGTGLGLSTVHGFAHQSGGSAKILSEQGRGTKVCLCLPAFEHS